MVMGGLKLHEYTLTEDQKTGVSTPAISLVIVHSCNVH